MQTQNRFFDDLARVAAGAMGTLSGMRSEVESRVREQFERVLAGMDLGSWFAGTPGQLVDLLKGIEERYPGMEHISLSSPIGTPKAMMLEQIQWIAEEVMPAFKPGAR